jgi:uncharacterized protein YndB with AHSA1/START domain
MNPMDEMNEPQIDETRTITASVTATWAAVTLAQLARLWWGVLDQDADAVGRQLTLRTGTSSRHRLWVERLEPPSVLEFLFAYLGVSGPDLVRIDLRPDRGGVELRLREWIRDPEPATVHLTRQLWRYRLHRLKTVLEDGPRQPEPDELILSRPLRSAHWRPLHQMNVRRWLPVSDDSTPPRYFYVVDSLGARPFPVTSWQQHYDERLKLGIAVARSGPVTRAELAIEPGHGGSEPELYLQVRHRGWTNVNPDAEVRQLLRSTFLATWRTALEQAAEGLYQ